MYDSEMHVCLFVSFFFFFFFYQGRLTEAMCSIVVGRRWQALWCMGLSSSEAVLGWLSMMLATREWCWLLAYTWSRRWQSA